MSSCCAASCSRTAIPTRASAPYAARACCTGCDTGVTWTPRCGTRSASPTGTGCWSGAVLRTAHPSAVVSHVSAAVEHGAAVWGIDLETVHLTPVSYTHLTLPTIYSV